MTNESVNAGLVPHRLRERFASWVWELAYRGERATTYRLSGSSGEVQYLKVAPMGFHPSVVDESRRLKWAREFLPVPRLIEADSDGLVEWLITEGLSGADATVAVARLGKEAVVRALARGLRSFHQAPAAGCPFDFGVDAALALAEKRLREGSIDPDRDFHPEHAHLSAADAVRTLERTRPDREDRVVCHGDYSAPNVLIEGESFAAFLDLGELGTADAWWDLAVGSWSVGWNFGTELEPLFLSEYGADDDPRRRAFYRLLYDVVS